MSSIVFKSTAPASDRFRPILDWLRQIRVAAGLAENTAQHLPDHYLADIGVKRGDIEKNVDDAISRLGLLDTGWQPPRRRSTW